MANKEYVQFHNPNESDTSSYKNRTNNLYSYNEIIEKYSTLHGFQPTQDIKKFLRLKALDKEISEDVVSSPKNLESPENEVLTLEESKNIQAIVDGMKAEQFVQMFLDRYMSPFMSDIDYRLGKVTAKKVYATDFEGNVVYDDYKSYAQYDKYGRIDTAVNLRMTIPIEGLGNKWGRQVIPATKEYYMNWFFPPFKLGAFDDDTTLAYSADDYIRNRKWNNATKSWVYPENFDPTKYTFDTKNYLSLRDKPTYRRAAYKSINDNISLLQHIMEETTGIVSTYLTEWDISLYIQEGLLSDNARAMPSYLGLCNRITKDNPTSLKGSNALVYGVLNGAVSKTPINTPTPNKSPWNPAVHPLSTYWWPMKSVDRGDGLDLFYDVAKNGFLGTKYNNINSELFSHSSFSQFTFREKIRYYDCLGAAYSGWYNWDSMCYWQALYTTPDDGFSVVDIVHLTEPGDNRIFNTVGDTQGIIEEIIDALYDDDNSLGFAQNEWEETINLDTLRYMVKVYKRNLRNGNAELQRYRIVNRRTGETTNYDAKGNTPASGSSVSQEGGISILGVEIPGSALLKMFLKKDTIKDKAMKVANKTSGKDYASASSGNGNLEVNFDSDTGTASIGIAGNANNADMEAAEKALKLAGLDSLLDANDAETAQYARHDGIPQWTPALYGGPHGRYYAPNTIQGYFEKDNEFYRNIPRIDTLHTPNSHNPNSNRSHFRDVESRYNFMQGTNYGQKGNINEGTEVGRSPSKCLSLLQKGFVDYIYQPVLTLQKSWYDSPNPNIKYYGGRYLNYTGQIVARRETYGTGFITPTTGIDLNYGYNYHNCYSYSYYYYYYYNSVYNQGNTRYYEWEYYYRYRSGSDYYYKNYHMTVGYGVYTGNTSFYGWRSYYHLMKTVTRYYWETYYYSWQYVDFPRPLMHSNPSAHWTINKGFVNVYTTKSTWWNSPLSWLIRTIIGLFTSWTPAPVIEKTSSSEVYRLTFPNGGYYNPYMSWAEKDFREKCLGNGRPANSGNHKIFFFASSGGREERMRNGPDLMFQADACLSTYTYKYLVAIWYRYRRGCRWRWGVRYEWRVGTENYVKVDIPNAVRYNPQYGNTKGYAWTNLWSSMSSGKKQEIYKDTPSSYAKLNRWVTSISTLEEAVSSSPYNYYHYWRNEPTNYGEVGLHGWGYTTCLPGFSITPSFNSCFEDPQDYLDYNVIIPDAADKAIRDLKVPFYSLNTDSGVTRCSGMNSSMYYAQGVKAYGKISSDRGIQNFFQKLYTTSTFFMYKEGDLSGTKVPYLISNDSQIRTLARVANHQKAWLKYAKEFFVNNIEFEEVLKLIANTVEPQVLARSVYSPSSTTYDQQSTLYHYWIDRAVRFFSVSANKQKIQTEYDNRIKYLETFTNGVDALLGRTADFWSFNELNESYKTAIALRSAMTSNSTLEDYMFAYLNVLYEYRKFFINKRCNKIDGTLWQLRQLEGVIPSITANIKDIKESGGGGTEEVKSDGTQIHSYKVDYYNVHNSNYDKVAAATNPKKQLDVDRTMTLYFKVKYVSETKAKMYLAKVISGTDSPKDPRIIYIPDEYGGQGKYAEVPFDGLYQYLSKEYLSNQVIVKKNKKLRKAGVTSLLQQEADIDECKFQIDWIKSSGGGIAMCKTKGLSKAAKLSLYKNKLGMGQNEVVDGVTKKRSGKYYPYIYKAPKRSDKNSVSIKFGVHSGINPSDLAALMKMDTQFDGLDAVCATKVLSDYWKVTIPVGVRPRASGYITSLKIKTYVPPVADPTAEVSMEPSTGVFGYMLYPITEEQADTIPGIGLDMTKAADKLKDALV